MSTHGAVRHEQQREREPQLEQPVPPSQQQQGAPQQEPEQGKEQEQQQLQYAHRSTTAHTRNRRGGTPQQEEEAQQRRETAGSSWVSLLCDRLAPTHTTSQRLTAVADLEHSLSRYSYTNTQLCAVWGQVHSLLLSDTPAAHAAVFDTMDAINAHQPISAVGTLRVEFLHTLSTLHSATAGMRWCA